MTYWWNEIGDRISLFNLADICPKAWFSIPSLGIENQALGRSYLLALLFLVLASGILSIKA